MRVQAIDYDDDGLNSRVTFTNISHLNPAVSTPLFRISNDGNNNQGVIRTNQQLDRLDGDQYIMVITMEDQGTPKNTGTTI